MSLMFYPTYTTPTVQYTNNFNMNQHKQWYDIMNNLPDINSYKIVGIKNVVSKQHSSVSDNHILKWWAQANYQQTS